MIKSLFSSCGGCNRSKPEQVERDTPAQSRVDGRSAVGHTVYYDAREFLSETGSSVFVPLSLSLGTSLDEPASVTASSSQAPKDDDGRQSLPPRSLATSRRAKQVKASKGRFQSTILFRNRLEETSPVLDLSAGFPGHLSETELAACLEFRKQLKEGDSIYRDMVYCYREVEEEPYSICRFLRARNFNVHDTCQMMDENVKVWKEGQAHDFFPDPSVAIGGAPESALLTQLPLVMGGTARNGCPVLYLVTGPIRAEGIECVTSLDNDIPNYVWYFAVHKIKRHVAAAQAKDPSRFVRVQLMVVVDLKNLSYSLLTRVLSVLEKALKILGVFPELLFNVVILNAPRFFAGFWPVIKAFVDPATARKFELYSDPDEGKNRLTELVSMDELASDYGGSAASTAELMAQSAGSGVSRQIVELITSHTRSEAVYTFKLRENETAAITIYTNATDGAEVSLCKVSEKNPLSTVTMTRTAREPKDGAFFRELSPSCHGPESYQVVVKRQSGPRTAYFVIVGNVSQTYR